MRFGKPKAKQERGGSESFESNLQSSQDLILKNEDLVTRVPLKGNVTLFITTKRLMRSHNTDGGYEKLQGGYGLSMKNIRMAFPLKQDQFAVHYIGLDKEFRVEKRYREIYDIDLGKIESGKSDSTICSRICRTIANTSERVDKTPPNRAGWLVLHDEAILTSCKSRSKYGTGILYVTTRGVYFEQEQKGLCFELPFSMFYWTKIHRSKSIRIQYFETHRDGNKENHYFDVRPEVSAESVKKIIDEAYEKNQASFEHKFEVLHQMFKEKDGLELKKIYYNKTAWADSLGKGMKGIGAPPKYWEEPAFVAKMDLIDYIYKLAQNTFQYERPVILEDGKEPDFSQVDEHVQVVDWRYSFNNNQIIAYTILNPEWRAVAACLFTNTPIDVLGVHSEEYLKAMSEYKQVYSEHKKFREELGKAQRKFNDMESSAQTKQGFARILKTPEYAEAAKKIEEIKLQWAKLLKTEVGVPRWNSISRYYYEHFYKIIDQEESRLVRKIYDHWKKNIKLTEFTDDSDPSWQNWILENIPWPTQDWDVYVGSATSTNKILTGNHLLQKEQARSSDVKKSLASFTVPKNVLPSDTVNTDCWYDEDTKQWFSRCEKASLAKRFAVMTPDQARKTYGFSAWVFDKEHVVKKFGMPAIKIGWYDEKLGEPLETPGERFVILSALPEDKFTHEMVVEMATFKCAIYKDADFGKGEGGNLPILEVDTVEPKFTLENFGTIFHGTVAELPFHLQKNYGEKSLPLYERIRRFHFRIISGKFVITKPEDWAEVEREHSITFGAKSTPENEALPTIDREQLIIEHAINPQQK